MGREARIVLPGGAPCDATRELPAGCAVSVAHRRIFLGYLTESALYMITVSDYTNYMPGKHKSESMMVLHFTDKLRKKLHIPELTREEETTGKLLRWYANLFTAQRVQYILTTNVASLFSVVIYGRGLVDDGEYIQRFLGELREHLDDLELRLLYDRVIQPNSGQIILAKTSDRSVLGSMNDMVGLCKHKLELNEASPWKLTLELNDTPFGAIGYGFPREVIARLAVS